MRRCLLLVAAFGLFAASCGGGSKCAAAAAAKASTNQPVESFENKLPGIFPKDFPLPQDRTAVYSLTQGKEKTDVFFMTGASYEDTRAFYLKELPESGWPIATCGQLEDPIKATFMTANKNGCTANVIIGFIAAPNAKVKEYRFIVEIAHAPVSTLRPGMQSCV